MELIYHKPNTIESSPFDEALFKVSHNANPLYLTSPYIGINFLKRLLGESNNWKLVSDIEAWLRSGNRKHRAKCWQFIIENEDRIKHLPDLHAKVAIGNNLVFLGSANFTDKGILGRTEMSVLINEPSAVSESITWFENIWSIADYIVIEEGDELVRALDELKWTAPNSRVKLTSAAPKIKSILFGSSRPVGYDVASSFALASIEESVKQLTLEEAYSRLSDAWYNARKAFTFKELFEALKAESINTLKADLWNLVIHETTNHWLGGIYIDGFDRYAYIDKQFIPWGSDHLTSINQIDRCLHFILSSFEIEPRALPRESDWLNINVAAHQIYPIVNEFISSGLIEEVDNPGELLHYSFEPNFSWPKRWKKFKNSHTFFLKKVADFNESKVNETNTTVVDDDEFSGAESEFTLNLEAIQWSSMAKAMPNQSSKNMQISEVAQTAALRGMSFEEIIEHRESILTAAFELIESRARSLNKDDAKSLIEELERHSLPKKLMANLRDETGGPLIFKKKGEVKIAKNWNSKHYLTLYPKSLAAWNKLLESSTKQ